MYNTLPKIFAGIAMLVCFTHSKVSAQESVSQNTSDLSFELVVNSEADRQYAEICIDALLRYDNLDGYRFVHSNRNISFQIHKIEVILLSAQELLLSSGRFIQEACIDHGDVYADVEFRLILQDGVYAIAPIFTNEKELICP
jgi:hypothetical protein